MQTRDEVEGLHNCQVKFNKTEGLTCWVFSKMKTKLHFFFFNNVSEAMRSKRSLIFLIKRVNDVSFSCRSNAGNFNIRHQVLKTGTTPSLDRERSSVFAGNEACLETALQHFLPATLRMKVLLQTKVQVAAE